MIILPRDSVTCDLCAERSVYQDRKTGRHWCRNHLELSIHDRVRAVLDGRVGPDDTIGVALSGGKDSTVLLHLLHFLRPEWGNPTIIALTVDEGIAGYRKYCLDAARELTGRLGVPHQVIGFSPIAGNTLDVLVKGREERSCTICGVLRRKALQVLAREHGVSFLATGHCLNDEAQTVLMNCFRGDLPHLLRSPETDKRWIPRVKPLRRVSEKEITLYAMLEGIYRDLPECPYAHYALRSEVRVLLDRLEFDTPGTMERILSFQERIASLRTKPSQAPDIIPCDCCGEPSVTGRCRACTILLSIRSPSSSY